MRVLGIDLALIRTGYAVLDDGALVGSGVIVTTSRQAMALRLLHIRDEVYGVVRAYGVDLVAVESSVDFQRHLADGAKSIDALAMARAAALIACAEAGVKAILVNPGHVRSVVCNNMTASKLQVVANLRMRGFELPVKRNGEVDLDISDAVCLAVCVWKEERWKQRIKEEATWTNQGS